MVKGSVAMALSAFGLAALAMNSIQFRGPDRNGVYPETGLMKQWPESGPQELWAVEGIGQGYASLAIADGSLYLTGVKDEIEYVYAFDLQGEKRWEASLGEAHPGNGFPGARATPTVDGDAMYVMNSMGQVFRLATADGAIAWQVDLSKRFESVKTPYFGFSESVLLDGDRVVCTPGGKDATLAALDKNTGETVWTTSGTEDAASYCSIRIFDNGKLRQYITMTGQSMIGVNPADGALLWRYPYKAEYDIHAVSPVFYENYIYVSDGYKQGGTMLELAADGKSVTKRWTDKNLDCHHGGLVQVDGYVYGAASNGDWVVLDIKTGEAVQKIRAVGKGSAIYADGMLIGYGEKGKLGLFKASPKSLELVSSFEVEKGRGQHWAHPVISDGRLYVRHGDALMAYQIKAHSG